MATVKNVNFLLLNELNAIMKVINEASQNEVALNTLRKSLIKGDIVISNKKLKLFIGELLNLKFDRSCSNRKLYGEELDNYLQSKLTIIECKSDFPTYSNRNFNELILFLKENSKLVIEFSRKKLFSNYCHSGYVMDTVYDLYQEKRRKKEVKEPFNVFVKKSLDISSHYALKLRTLGKIWFQYKKLEHLSISFDEFYHQKDEILSLMHNHPVIASSWQDIDFETEDMDVNEDVND
jgi:hypothetical protein